jgi:hypothetical protein
MQEKEKLHKGLRIAMAKPYRFSLLLPLPPGKPYRFLLAARKNLNTLATIPQ